ncbi:unnamed protein product [Didymodactylos carnosus]|uniref:Ubiquitin-like domain-containing protein n=1 Tax=Didymodactylos carnosus TaxID=1234261 RepID=A0A813STN6_9BILA|nr:unnamed protein product [Didymodactylos carnosus]CAF0722392.1 unnamed protein product [Didymodactylos carnosus]CAF0799715.1 unnamed protein product [Didymodactylos carnosus]CAF3494197.1 unnamed protein product [Didymodactylos carnosus]CAF3494269.1 unnamed protein product [Didymodactylos carnosus]
MGVCVSSNRERHGRSRYRPNTGTINGVSVGRNKPLSRTKLKWKSDVPLSENQLRRKREEFWDTAPSFEGRKEIWDALHGGVYAIEQNDYDLAQSIINCANITCPFGSLLDCYDELGTRYQLPIYVLTAPTNLADESSDSPEGESGISETGLDQTTSSSSPTLSRITKLKNPVVREIKKHQHRRKKSSDYNDSSGNGQTSTVNGTTTTPTSDISLPIKFRLSNGKEHKLPCKQQEKIRNIKRRLATLENIDAQSQRLFFGGKQLNDRNTIEDIKLQRNFVVQVFITSINDAPLPPVTTTVANTCTSLSSQNDYSNTSPAGSIPPLKPSEGHHTIKY